MWPVYAVVLLLSLGPPICDNGLSDWAEWDPGGDPGIPYWVRGWTFWSDVVVRGIVTDIEVASPTGQAITFISLVPDTFAKGECAGDVITFYFYGAADTATSWLRAVPAPSIGDTLLAWIERDAMDELFSRQSMAIKRGAGAWTARDDCYGQPAHSLETYEEWARALTLNRTPEHLAIVSDAVVVVFVQAIRHSGADPRFGSVAELRVEQALYGASEGTVIEVAVQTAGGRDMILVHPGTRMLLFLELQDEGGYHILGGRDGAYLLTQSIRCIPAKAVGSRMPGLPCDKCGRASRCPSLERRLFVSDVKRMVAARHGGATSN